MPAPKKRKKRSGIILADSDDESKHGTSELKHKSHKPTIYTSYNINNSSIEDDEFDEDGEGPVIVDEHIGISSNAAIVTTFNRNTKDHVGGLSNKMIIDDISTKGLALNTRDVEETVRANEDDDLSPPRRDDPELSPPVMEDEINISTSRGLALNTRDVEETVRANEDDDLSPPRRDDPELSPPVMEDEINTSVVYRDKRGKKIDAKEWAKLQPKKWEKTERPTRQIPEWGKGLVQMESAKERAAKEAIIASQPFARNDIDEDFDKELKDTIRWDDPILMFDTEKRKKTIEQKSDGKPKCRFHAPPNRFNIPPGYRWDGVIRGNGYEERRFREIALMKARNEEAYIENVADN
ncbi:pre-mRNA-splicing factor CWC26 [Babesia microti strain RI]|uniref:Pre-mRNA-splicing factor CWC26 n=1 Tax=Babesia microti (strain RI) TaxID=1133968 RepID=A0A1R4ABC8_BABMR|nr:pre-mRNA-splicing factor CWC26 [Babesia microti strain RI]SJK86255.1 pre-mRNA-splicing factor CWC26 [Babesia microti strain RI]|eukprot:XP_021338437.1 pre-mRNA-splicing factor CWC26 [Babesia microti strain RI]